MQSLKNNFLKKSIPFVFQKQNLSCKTCIHRLKKECGNICIECKSVECPSIYLKHCNYFELFNLKPEYNIKLNELNSSFKATQKLIHPDKYYNQEGVEKDAQNNSSHINIAYSVLKDDFKRANYLLELEGYEKITENSKFRGNNDLLLKLLDIQEKIEEANSKIELDKINEINEKEILDIKKNIENLFKCKNFESINYQLQLLNFHITISNFISNKQENLTN